MEKIKTEEADPTVENPFRPWVPPFKYDDQATLILDFNGERILDMRGWGFLTGKGVAALTKLLPSRTK